MPFKLRFLRLPRLLRRDEVQAKIPMLNEPALPAKRTWSWIPVRDPEIYPLLICVTTGLSLLAFYNLFNLGRNPEVRVSKARRESQPFTPEESHQLEEQAKAYAQHRARIAQWRSNPVNASVKIGRQQQAEHEDVAP